MKSSELKIWADFNFEEDGAGNTLFFSHNINKNLGHYT